MYTFRKIKYIGKDERVCELYNLYRDIQRIINGTFCEFSNDVILTDSKKGV